jgi:hypothetical protein
MPLQGEDVLSGAMSSPRPSASAVRTCFCVNTQILFSLILSTSKNNAQEEVAIFEMHACMHVSCMHHACIMRVSEQMSSLSASSVHTLRNNNVSLSLVLSSAMWKWTKPAQRLWHLNQVFIHTQFHCILVPGWLEHSSQSKRVLRNLKIDRKCHDKLTLTHTHTHTYKHTPHKLTLTHTHTHTHTTQTHAYTHIIPGWQS